MFELYSREDASLALTQNSGNVISPLVNVVMDT